MRIAVIGSGSWGTTVAALAAATHPVLLWARRAEVAETINREAENVDYLPGFRLPGSLRATSDLAEAAGFAEAVVMAVPSHGFRTVFAHLAGDIDDTTPILSLVKGIEQGSDLRMTEVILEEHPSHDPGRVGVMAGPNLAGEVSQGSPAATVIAMQDTAAATLLQTVFMSPTFRVYTNTDVVGCEVAGSVKNVMAIAAGMTKGLGFGHNTLAALITRALAEMTRLGTALGGRPETFSGLAGMGDLIATCQSDQSRNNRVGTALAHGRGLDEIVAEMRMVAEGVKTVEPVLTLADRVKVEMPIAQQVRKVLYEGAHPRDSVLTLMTREARSEV